MERRYAAFISYSHKADALFSKYLESVLEHFASPLPWRRKMRIFRDEADLAANPDLWGSIKSALDASRRFLLLASPESASSKWVARELGYFLASNDPTQLCILLTRGTTPWTDPEKTDGAEPALPLNLESQLRALGQEPLIIDFRPFVKLSRRRLRYNQQFLSRAASVAATILERDKDEIYGAHIRAQRRWIAALMFASVCFAVIGTIAVVQSRLAVRRLQQAVSVAERIHFVVDRRLEAVAGAAGARKELLESSSMLLDELLVEAHEDSEVLYQRMVAHVHEGDLALSRGQSVHAKEELDKAWQIASRLSRLDNARSEWIRYQTVILDRLGDLLAAKGSLSQALLLYERSRKIIEQLVATHPDKKEWQRDLGVSYSIIGAIHEARGDLQSAVSAAEAELVIAGRLAEEKADDQDRQHDLHRSLYRAGRLNVIAGGEQRGFEQLSRARDLIKSLADAEPDNALWRSDLAANLSLKALLHWNRGDYQQALKTFQEALNLQLGLSRQEPGNVEWKGNVSLTRAHIGDAFRTLGKFEKASEALRNAEAMQKGLIQADPENRTWSFYLARTMLYRGDLALNRGNQKAALSAFQQAAARARALVGTDPTNTDYADFHSICVSRLADIYERLGDLRARAKITSHFYAPMHPAWRCCQTAEISRYSCASAPCQAGASTPKNVNLFLREPLPLPKPCSSRLSKKLSLWQHRIQRLQGYAIIIQLLYRRWGSSGWSAETFPVDLRL